MAAFLDIEGPFKNLDANAAVKAMKEHDIPKMIINGTRKEVEESRYFDIFPTD